MDDLSPLERNLMFREAFTRTMVAKTAQEAMDALEGHLYKQPGMPTLEDCRRLLGRLVDRFELATAFTIFQRFGIKSFDDLWIGQYKAFCDFAEACLNHGIPPTASWDDAFNPYPAFRRYLFRDCETGALFEKKEWTAQIEAAIREGVMTNVTGVDKYESIFLRAQRQKAREEEL